MTTLYKLTRPDWTTHGGCKWGLGVEHRTNGKGNLCGPGFTHWYTDQLLAVLLDPIHGNFGADAVLWEGEGVIAKTDYGLKVGCTRGRTDRIIEMPAVSMIQRVAFGIFCSLALQQPDSYRVWGRRWLSGEDRSVEAARAAAETGSTETWATWAVGAARTAAWAAVWVEAARVVEVAARVAQWAAEAAELDLPSIARQAMEIK